MEKLEGTIKEGRPVRLDNHTDFVKCVFPSPSFNKLKTQFNSPTTKTSWPHILIITTPECNHYKISRCLPVYFLLFQLDVCPSLWTDTQTVPANSPSWKPAQVLRGLATKSAENLHRFHLTPDCRSLSVWVRMILKTAWERLLSSFMLVAATVRDLFPSDIRDSMSW